MNFFDYRVQRERRLNGAGGVTTTTVQLTKAERYVKGVATGGGSRKFKEWLSSSPMDKFVVCKVKKGASVLG